MSDINEENKNEGVVENTEAEEVVEGAVETEESVEPAESEEPPKNPKINYDDFAKVEITIGEIKSAEKVAGADRLLRLEVDFGDHQRQIVSGIAEYYEDPADLIGTKCPFVTNLEPRTIRGLESDGMIMAALDREQGIFSLPKVDESIPAGTKLS
jgi:methionyl-tRNA synthetase